MIKTTYNYIKAKLIQFKNWLFVIFVGTIVLAAGGSQILPSQTPVVNSYFDFNGKTINCECTDDNTNEDLIIRTDKSHYGGWNATEIFFSIENISDRTEITDIQFYFAGKEIVASISELKKDVPYQISVNDYGVKNYECEKNWTATTTSEMGEEYTQYICGEEIKYCDVVKETICTVDNDFIGTHEETRYKDKFHELVLAESKVLSQEIPVSFQAKKKVVYNIPAGEIKFFKAKIEFEPKTNGQFLIFAEGVLNRGKLK